MPRLRPRMTARRGGSRGRSADDRSFPSRHGMDFSFDPHGQLPSSPLHVAPPDPATSGPPPPRNLFTRYTTQRAELHFESVFNHPSITAYITVTLSEEATLSSHIWPDSPSAMCLDMQRANPTACRHPAPHYCASKVLLVGSFWPTQHLVHLCLSTVLICCVLNHEIF